MALKRTLFVNWCSINGAAQGKRKLVLRSNDNGHYTCPIASCLHKDFKSKRGLRKHIDHKHGWYYYFDSQPEVKREEIEQIQPVILKRASTATRPSFSIDKGIGKEFLDWLCTSCGGGKTEREAKQIAKRALKFLMECSGENESDVHLSHDLIDCCLGSATIIMRFLVTIETEWKLSSSSSLSYVKSITDLLDFRKASGVTDNNLRCFTITEVYLRRAKENLRKKKNVECTRKFDLETLIARDSWATLEEMENVIPYHIEKFKRLIDKCKSQNPLPNKNELCFCTRFLTTFLFLRVKCSRPMTFQYLTLPMVEKARLNKGFIDQTEFKTANKYAFDTLIIDSEVFTILDAYIDYVRPLLNPKCDYLLLSSTGRQYNSLTTAMTMLVHEAIGKYIHPTRYRQIVETTSADRLTREEQETISEDQKHSSTVAKIYYKKKQSRNVAIEGKKCMEKMLGNVRSKSTISNVISDLSSITSKFGDNNPVLCQASRFINLQNEMPSDSSNYQTLENLSKQSSAAISSTTEKDMITATQELMNVTSLVTNDNESIPNYDEVDDMELVITKSIECNQSDLIIKEVDRTKISADVELKKEVANNEIRKSNKNVKFSLEEDEHLKQGLKKYGKRNWSCILKDSNFNFHKSRTRDSLRIRADSATFKRFLKK